MILLIKFIEKLILLIIMTLKLQTNKIILVFS